MIKTLIFDFDGTIADTLNLAMDLFNKLSPVYKYSPITEKNIMDLKNMGAKGFIAGLNMNPMQISEVIELVKKEESALISNMNIFPGMYETLLALKEKGIGLGILTSNAAENAHLFLTKNKIGFFDFVVSENDLFGKDIVLKKILDERGLLADETMYVGDEDRDVEAAKKAGLKSVAVTWGYNSEEHLRSTKPDYLIKSPRELLSLK